MAGMTKDQREYALKRLGTALAAEEAAVKEKYTTPAVVVSSEDRLRMILSGEATLNRQYLEEKGVEGGHYFWRFFDFPVHAKAVSIDLMAVHRDLAPIKAEYTRLQDEIMLGDAATALAMIRDFEVFIQKGGKPWPSR